MACKLPTVTINEVSQGIDDATTSPTVKRVLEGLLNDYMDLQFGKETPYTTGKQVLPSGATIQDVDKARGEANTERKFKDVFEKISDTFKSGDLTPQTPGAISWDPKLKPVLVLITPNN